MFRITSGMSQEDIDKKHTERCHGAAKFKADKKKRKVADESRRRNR